MSAKKTLAIHRVISSSLKLFFRLLYHEFAWSYNWVAAVVSLGRWNSWVYSVIPYLDKSIILELGSGPGQLQTALAKKGIHAFGIDASWQMAKQARNRLRNLSSSGNISYGRSQSLPFASGKFDQVVATFPSEYIVDPDTLGQIWRVLKSDGELIVLPAAWITGSKWWDRLAAGLFRITGQAPNFDPESGGEPDIFSLEFIEKFGFYISREIIELPSSKVLLIRAQKSCRARNVEELG